MCILINIFFDLLRLFLNMYVKLNDDNGRANSRSFALMMIQNFVLTNTALIKLTENVHKIRIKLSKTESTKALFSNSYVVL